MEKTTLTKLIETANEAYGDDRIKQAYSEELGSALHSGDMLATMIVSTILSSYRDGIEGKNLTGSVVGDIIDTILSSVEKLEDVKLSLHNECEY